MFDGMKSTTCGVLLRQTGVMEKRSRNKDRDINIPHEICRNSTRHVSYVDLNGFVWVLKARVREGL